MDLDCGLGWICGNVSLYRRPEAEGVLKPEA